MNWAHVHLLLNHTPVLGTAFGLALAAGAIARRSGELAKAGFAVFVCVAVLAVLVYFTGEGAEGIVGQLPGVDAGRIERHQEAALIALIPVELLGLFSLGALFLFHRARSMPSWVMTAALVLSLVGVLLMARTALLGGRIRHEEARSGFRPPAATPGPAHTAARSMSMWGIPSSS